MCPMIIKERAIFSCKLVSTRHSRYPTIALLLFGSPVVRMEVDVLTKPMYLKEMMKHVYDGTGSLTDVSGLVNKVIHLTWNSPTAYSIIVVPPLVQSREFYFCMTSCAHQEV